MISKEEAPLDRPAVGRPAGILSRLQRWCCMPRWLKQPDGELSFDDQTFQLTEEEEEDCVDEYGDAGEPCDICNDEEKVKTHFARPCRHCLCKTCWERWLECSSKCPICGTEVTRTQRFPSSLVPLQYHELASRVQINSTQSAQNVSSQLPQLYSLNSDLEKASLQLISSLVQSKDFFANMGATIDEVHAHLVNLTAEGLDLETRLSIVAVEKSTIAEHFEKLAEIMSDSSTSSWFAVNHSIQTFTAAVSKLSDVLDAGTEDKPSGLSSTQNLLSNCTVSMLRGQFSPMNDGLLALTNTKIPAVLQALSAAQHPMNQMNELEGMKRAVLMLQTQASERIQYTQSLLDRLLPELEVASVRVQSLFC